MSPNDGVDIQMPVRFRGYIEGRVLRALFDQDVVTRLFVDASTDLDLSGDASDLLDTIAPDDDERTRIELRLRAGTKRNRLMHSGSQDFVYLADPDVLIPRRPGLFGIVAAASHRRAGSGRHRPCLLSQRRVARRRGFDDGAAVGLRATRPHTWCGGLLQLRLHQAGVRARGTTDGAVPRRNRSTPPRPTRSRRQRHTYRGRTDIRRRDCRGARTACDRAARGSLRADSWSGSTCPMTFELPESAFFVPEPPRDLVSIDETPRRDGDLCG